MSPILQEALSFLKPAADAVITGVVSDVPTLSADGLNFLENVVAPKLDVPASVIALATAANSTIEATVDPFAVAELELLKARVDALL